MGGIRTVFESKKSLIDCSFMRFCQVFKKNLLKFGKNVQVFHFRSISCTLFLEKKGLSGVIFCQIRTKPQNRTVLVGRY